MNGKQEGGRRRRGSDIQQATIGKEVSPDIQFNCGTTPLRATSVIQSLMWIVSVLVGWRIFCCCRQNRFGFGMVVGIQVGIISGQD